MLYKKIGIASALGLVTLVSPLISHSLITPSSEKGHQEWNREEKNKPSKETKKLYKRKVKTKSPAGPLPIKVCELPIKSFQAKYFEWNPENLAEISDLKYIQIEPRKSLFFRTNIGIGFLYYTGLSANLGTANSPFTQNYNISSDTTLKRRLLYNQVPLYEYTFGRRFTRWFNLGLSYQYQGGMTLQSQLFIADAQQNQFISNLSINSIQMKCLFEWPLSIPIRNFLVSPYFGLAGGLAWQSWTRLRLSSSYELAGTLITSDYYLKPSYQASGSATGDFGFRTQCISPYYPLSFRLGCKFNYWGQVRNLGALDKQGNFKRGFKKPLRIKAFYQWTPYVSAEWNFTPVWKSVAPYKIGKYKVNRWAPFFCWTKHFSPARNFWTEANVGLGSLEFKGLRGIFRSLDNDSFFKPVIPAAPVRCNRTPLFEYQVGYRFLPWLKTAFSYQYQNGISIRTTREVIPTLPPSNGTDVTTQYISNLTLNSLTLKGYLTSPAAIVAKNTATSAFFGFGIGASWQTWNNSLLNYSLLPTSPDSDGIDLTATYPLKQKIVANIATSGCAGLSIQSAYPNSPYTINLGVKFNYWGQARNLISLKNDSSIKAINNFLTIKQIYQWAPYVGFQWNFLPTFSQFKDYKINQKSIYRFFPFWVHQRELQARQGPFAGLNIGLGLLTFDRISGNFIAKGAGLHLTYGNSNYPFKGRLKYTPSALYEYLMGYTLIPEIKLALSLQHQGGINVQTKALTTPQVDDGVGDIFRAQTNFSSNLNLDSLILKTYLYSPWPMIMLGGAYNLYIGLGGGISLQTWYNTEINHQIQEPNNAILAFNFKLRQTYCANPAGMADAGIVFQSAYPATQFSFRLGCKFNYWGQARNIGALSKQDTAKIYLFKPFRIRGLYQIAPYGGVEWNF